MTPPAQFPAGADRAAIRRWLKERREADPVQGPTPTHESLLANQRQLLMTAAGMVAEDGASTPAGHSEVPAASEAGSRRRLDLALDGGQVVGHEAPLGLLGPFFTSLQLAVTSVAQALAGVPTAAAQVPGKIRAATMLSSAPAFPSSYGVHLFGPVQDFGLLQPEDASTLRSTLLDETIATILDIADTAQASPGGANEAQADDRLVERVVPLGQRAVKHLGELSGHLAAAEATLRLSWEPGTDHARSCVLGRDGAAHLKRLSDGVVFGEATTEIIRGKLVEANMRRGSVEIEKASGEVISARTHEQITPQLGNNLLSKQVVAEATVTTAHYIKGREKRAYLITSLDLAENP